MSLILASTSPFRRQLLEQAGLVFQCERPDFEEQLPEGELPDNVALMLAEGKAEAVAERHPEAVVIGADQVGEWRGHLLGKPADAAAARAQLARLAGDTHRLITGVVVIGATPDDGSSRPTVRLLEETRLTFRPLTDREIDAYVATGEWEGCAGGYRLEGRGIQLIEKIEGDYFNIIGLPLIPLLATLRRLGINPLAGLE
jgi:septum formation protein